VIIQWQALSGNDHTIDAGTQMYGFIEMSEHIEATEYKRMANKRRSSARLLHP
jgi:hypothetical protein